MEININDDDLMNIVNEIYDEIEVDDIIEEMDGESDEDHPLSNDSDCISDYYNYHIIRQSYKN